MLLKYLVEGVGGIEPISKFLVSVICRFMGIYFTTAHKTSI